MQMLHRYFTDQVVSVIQWQLGMTNGAFFGVPIPEKYEKVGEDLQEAAEAALAEADQNGMNKRGKEATPWLLRRIGELTKGKSLASS
jgi:pseudouridine-5'-phosphate glycosidase/pseudouridine kinase